MAPDREITVAVVGSGMAGLVTAYLLRHDPRKRYRVHVLEKKSELSLNSESIAIPAQDDSKMAWADVPMRAIAGGYYNNLIRMYDYLGVRYRPQNFVYSFAKLHQDLAGKGLVTFPHMIYTSNFHRLPPKPSEVGFLPWLIEAGYVLLWYMWFSICCFVVAPYEDVRSSTCETLEQYLRRIAIPQYYAANYLLPLMSSVCTCSHKEVLSFPARDVIDYKTRTHRQQHFLVDDGVQCVQNKLADGLDATLGVSLHRVTPKTAGVEIRWFDQSGAENVKTFDKVILAVSPDIVAEIFQPLQSDLSQIPTTEVYSVAHSDRSTLPSFDTTLIEKDIGALVKSTGSQAQYIHFRSDEESTESAHEQSTSVIVTTNPLTPIASSKIVRSSKFTRVLRNPKSRCIVNEIFLGNGTGRESDDLKGWQNGDGGVYLVGGWCWDGMVLLEGCIVSAMRAAQSLEVEVPWAHET